MEQLPMWLNQGIEPPTSVKNGGWSAGDKPPAEYMNWLLNRAYVCLNELQEITEELQTSKANQSTVTGINNNLTSLQNSFTSHLAHYLNDLAKKVNTLTVYEGDIDSLVTEGFYYVHGTSVNRPVNDASFYILNLRYNNQYIKQIAYRATGAVNLASEMYVRQMVNGSWQAWTRNITTFDLETIQNTINAKYTKPTNGIPKSDLTTAVQTSLGKADGALPVVNIAKGSVSITPTAINTPTSYVVTWSLPSVPIVTATPWTSAPATTKVSYSNKSTTGCTIWVERDATSAVAVDYIAIA